MALKGDRQYVLSSIDNFVKVASERGGIVSYNGTASGVAMDSAVNTVAYQANPSGVRPAGVLMQDVVDQNFTKQKLNPYKDNVPVGSKAFVLKQGQVTTNMIYPGHSPQPGQIAYVGHSGLFATSDVSNDAGQSATRIVGRFDTAKDQNGYAKVTVNLP